MTRQPAAMGMLSRRATLIVACVAAVLIASSDARAGDPRLSVKQYRVDANAICSANDKHITRLDRELLATTAGSVRDHQSSFENIIAATLGPLLRILTQEYDGLSPGWGVGVGRVGVIDVRAGGGLGGRGGFSWGWLVLVGGV